MLNYGGKFRYKAKKGEDMKNAIRLTVAVNMLFLVLYAVCSFFSGIARQVIYLLAFAIPFALGWVGAKRLRYQREEERGLAEADYPSFLLSPNGWRCFLPLAMPTVATVYLVALLTSLLLNAIGASAPPVADAPIWEMLLVHALLPAVLEEMLFRYLPLKILHPYSPRAALLLSALFFSLIHLDLYKMPYAFIAGIVMMCADIITGSILPSLIIHLVNNTASVLLMKYAELQTFSIVFYSVAGAAVLVSLVFVFLRGRDYIARVRAAISGRMEYDRSVIVMAGMCIIYAVMNLFG